MPSYYTSLYMALAMAGYSDAFFRMSCPGRIVRERIDPIVNPGKLSGHVHTISGGSGFKADMTFADARASKCSSCEIKEDMSNYWTPALYVHMKDGTYKPVPIMGDPQDVQGGMTVYYLQRPDPATEKLKAFPEGFRMLAGSSSKRDVGANDLATKAVNFACIGANQPETNSIPNYKCPGGLRAQIFFPSCWDGVSLDSPNHKSHMSYPNSPNYDSGPCPASHPVKTISLFFEVFYDTALFDDQWNGDQHPFVFANGDNTGYGFHGDFLNGWDVSVLQNAIDNCNDPSGDVSKCQAVSLFTPDQAKQCRIPTIVAEETGGVLQKLPGCNSIVPDPTCVDTTVFGSLAPNYIDLTQTKQWEYAGCGADNVGDRAFTGGSMANDAMTVEMCIDFCIGLGKPYAGLEFSRECFCTNELRPQYAPQDGIMGSCDFKCAGDSTQTCGGAGAMSIYHNCAGDTECKNWSINSVANILEPEESSSAAASSPTPPVQSPTTMHTMTSAPARTPSSVASSSHDSSSMRTKKAPGKPNRRHARQM